MEYNKKLYDLDFIKDMNELQAWTWENVDDFFIYVGSMVIGGSKTPTVADGLGVSNINEIIQLNLIETKKLGDGILLHYQLK